MLLKQQLDTSFRTLAVNASLLLLVAQSPFQYHFI